MRVLLDRRYLVNSFFFSFSPSNILFHCFLTFIISDIKPAFRLLGLPCQWWVFFSLLFSGLPYSLRFNIMCTVCLDVDLLHLGHWASWMYRLSFFIKLDNLLAIIFLMIFSAPVTLILWYSHYANDDALDVLSLWDC